MSETKVVTFGNYKGGTGKTTNSTMIGYALSELGHKVLLVDQDPQGNATSLYLRTKANLTNEVTAFEKTLMTAVKEENLKPIVTKIKENLYILPGHSDFSVYPTYLEKRFPNSEEDRIKFFKTILDPIKDDFDYVFIDVPPTESYYTHGALYASDLVVVVLQTHERSLIGAQSFIKYLQSLIYDYDADLDILGILPVLLKNNSLIDREILDTAVETFGEENMFKNVIKNMERLKRFDMTGITDEDMHDRKVHKVYKDVALEFLERMKKFQ